MSSTLCSIPSCRNHGRYCRLHSKALTPEKEPKPIKKESDKRKEVNKDYYAEAKAFVKANPVCKLNMKGCTKVAKCVHHRKGKDSIERLMDKRWWWPSCLHCNVLCEQKDAEARAKGIKLSKHSKEENDEVSDTSKAE